MNAETRLRHLIRSRAHDLRACVPEDLALEEGHTIEEVAEEEGIEVVVIVRKKRQQPADAPPHTLTVLPGPVQRYIAGCWLTDVEKAIVSLLLDGGNQAHPMPWLRDNLGSKLPEGHTPGEGPLKSCLARLTDPLVSVLENLHPGYKVRPEYVAFLLWVKEAKRLGVLSDAA